MVILNISNITNNQGAGTNINIPLFVKGIGKYEQIANLNCNDIDIDNLKGFDNKFTLKDIKKYDISYLPEPFNKPDLVVFQGIYIIYYPLIAKKLEKHGIPYIIIPRCSMTNMAQEKSKLKKKIFNVLLFNSFIKRAFFIEFLTKNEYIESKKSFKFNDYVIIGNGYNTPKVFYECKKRDEFKIVFIGRYALYHKGLDILLDAICYNKHKFIDNNIKFVLYGPNFEKGKDKLEQLVQEYKLEQIVELREAVFGEEKEKALLDADLFIHTSRFEGHPTSVIEAISYGIPVLVTPGTNMLEDVKNNKLGFFCNLDKKDISDTIMSAYKNRNKFKIISSSEKKFALENYDWSNIIKINIATYKHKLRR